MLNSIGGGAEHVLLSTDRAGHGARHVHLHVLLQHVLDVLLVSSRVVKHLPTLRAVNGSLVHLHVLLLHVLDVFLISTGMVKFLVTLWAIDGSPLDNTNPSHADSVVGHLIKIS